MRYVLSLIAGFSWALWMGGLVALFIFVSTIFSKDRSVAVQAAPMMFNAFEKYQLILAVIGLLAVTGFCSLTRSRAAAMVLALMLVCGIAGVVSSKIVTARMNTLREQGESGGAEHKRLHGYSMIVYTGEVALLGIAGLLLPAIIRFPSKKDQGPVERE